MSINRDAWLTALKDAGLEQEATDQDALTVEEFAAVIGVCRNTAQQRLGVLIAQGKAQRTNKRIQRSDGRPATVGAYRLITPEPPKARRRGGRA